MEFWLPDPAYFILMESTRFCPKYRSETISTEWSPYQSRGSIRPPLIYSPTSYENRPRAGAIISLQTSASNCRMKQAGVEGGRSRRAMLITENATSYQIDTRRKEYLSGIYTTRDI